MITLEQVKLLDLRVTKTVDYIKKVTGENALLKKKLDSCQQRINELEVLIQRFREDQNRIEEGILSALDRLNQFEDAVENALKSENKITPAKEVPQVKEAAPPAKEVPSESKAPETTQIRKKAVPEKPPEPLPDKPQQEEAELLLPENELDIF